MAEGAEEHKRRLDELVQEAAERLETITITTAASKQGNSLVSVKAPWFEFKGSLDTLLQLDDPEAKAAIIFSAHPDIGSIRSFSSGFDRGTSVALVGEALYRARVLKKLGSEKLSDEAYQELKGILHRIIELGYEHILPNKVVPDSIHGGRWLTFVDILENKVKGMQGVRVFYTEYGPGLYALKSQHQNIMTELQNLANDTLPENLVKRGFKPFGEYLAEKALREMAAEENGHKLLLRWFEEGLRAAGCVVNRETFDGTREYIPPELGTNAEKVVSQVRAERIPVYIEMTGLQKLANLVSTVLGEDNSKKAAAIKRAVISSDELKAKGYVRLIETTEGEIWYVLKKGVPDVEQFVTEALAAIKPGLLQRIRSIKLPKAVRKTESLEEEVTGGTPQPEIWQAYNSGDYARVLSLARMARMARSGDSDAEVSSTDVVLLTASSSLRLSMRIGEGGLSHKKQNELWRDFKEASRAYQALGSSVTQTTINAIKIVRADVSAIDDFERRIRTGSFEGKYRSGILEEAGRFKETYAAVLNKR